MALDGGGGGGGGPLGFANSFTGPATALEVAGDFAYAYSGFKAANVLSTTYLEFTTGNFLFVGQFQFNTPLEESDPTAGIEALCRIDFNGSGVSMIRAGADFADNADSNVTQDLIIPPYTEVKVVVDCHATDSNRFGTCTLVGRIYR